MPEATFGIIYNALKNEYLEYKPLAIMQLPIHLRETQLDLRYRPYYRLNKEDFILQIGARVLSLSVKNYMGWNLFSEEVNKVLSEVKKSEIIKKVERLGVRYISFFEEENLFDNINMEIRLNEKNILGQIVFRNSLDYNERFSYSLQITNAAAVAGKRGSIIDIDTSSRKVLQPVDFFDKQSIMLNEAHTIERSLFSIY